MKKLLIPSLWSIIPFLALFNFALKLAQAQLCTATGSYCAVSPTLGPGEIPMGSDYNQCVLVSSPFLVNTSTKKVELGSSTNNWLLKIFGGLIGLESTGDDYGVRGIGDVGAGGQAVGVYGEGKTGVIGQSSITGEKGVYGVNLSGTGVLGYGNTGLIGVGRTYGLQVYPDTGYSIKNYILGSLGVNISSPQGVFHVATGSINALVVDNQGNVGIRTTNPGAKLDVVGDIALKLQNSGNMPRIHFVNQTTGAVWQVGTFGGAGANDFSIGAYSGVSGNITITGSGNVGIGTTIPVSKLDVAGSIRAENGTYIVSTPWYNFADVPAGNYLVLSTPIVHNEGNMFSLEITGYTYATPDTRPVKIHCVGYAYSGSTLINHDCDTEGSTVPVYMTTEVRADQGNQQVVVVYIGDPSFNFYYPQMTVEYRGWKPKNPADFKWSYQSTPAPAANWNLAHVEDNSGPSYFNAGNVGIGTTTPQYKLHVVGRIQATGDICTDLGGGVCLSTAGGGGISGSGSAGQVAFWTATNTISGDNGLYWDNTNKMLGIGTTPSLKLHVYESAPDKSGMIVNIATTSSTYYIANFLSNGVSRLYIRADGNVGIPGFPTNNVRRLNVQDEIKSYGSGAGFRMEDRSDSGNAAKERVIYVYGDALRFWRGGSGDQVVIDSSGNVGIGTTNPTVKLDVNGDVKIRNSLLRDESASKYLFIPEQTNNNDFKNVTQLRLGPYFTLGNFGFTNTDFMGTNAILDYSSYGGVGSEGDANKFIPGYANGKGFVVNPSFEGTYSFYGIDWGGSTARRTFPADFTHIMTLTYNGNVGIGTTNPAAKLNVDPRGPGGILIGNPNTSSGGYTSLGITISAASNGYAILQAIKASGSAWGDIALNPNGGVVIVGGGAGKIDVGTVDPIYTIGLSKYATYLPGMTGVKEETVGLVNLKLVDGQYQAVLDFAKADRGSDLWLFYQITDFGKNWENVMVLLSASFKGSVWYEKKPKEKQIIIYGDKEGEVSYRLTAPRFDWRKHPNKVETETKGFVLDEKE